LLLVVLYVSWVTTLPVDAHVLARYLTPPGVTVSRYNAVIGDIILKVIVVPLTAASGNEIHRLEIVKPLVVSIIYVL
jgi:hypothetical protein